MDNLRNDKATGQGGNAGTANTSKIQSNTIKPPRKWQRVLAAFVRGESLNRFEAAKQYHDTCLHSTVSGIQDRGVKIERKDETVPGYMRIPTHVCRYWIAPDQRKAALNLLGIPEVAPGETYPLEGF
jgi:hypothetical protein